MNPKITLQVVSDVSEPREFIDRATNQTRKYVVRNISGVAVSDEGSAIVAASVPERVAFPPLSIGSRYVVVFSHFESRKGVWELTVAEPPREEI